MTAPYTGPADAATATATVPTWAPPRPLSADPWDAPYFGARTYFSYQPALVGGEAQTPAASGARVPATPETWASTAVDAAALAQVAAVASRGRRGWLARLLGRS